MEDTSNRTRRYAFVVAVILVLAATLYVLRNALAPVAAAMFLAYFLDPVVDRLEARKINRGVAIFILAGLVVVVAGGLGTFFALKTQRELVDLYNRFPGYVQTAQAKVVILGQGRIKEGVTGAGVSMYAGSPTMVIEDLAGVDLPDTMEQTLEEAVGQLDNLDPEALKPFTAALKKISDSTAAFLGWIIGLVIIPVFLFYFLRDWDVMKVEALEYVPHSHREYVADKARKIDEILSAFIRGQLTVCSVLGVLYSLGLMIVGIDPAVVIGMGAGLLFIVPYLGTIVGVAAATVMALLKFGFGWQLIGVWAVFGVVQLIEGMVLTPKVMGEKVGLSPVVVIFALLVGSDLLGILGMLMAVPAAAVIKVFIDEAVDKYKSSEFFLENSGDGEAED